MAHLEAAVPGFRTPQAVLARFCDLLAARGVLRRSRGGWAADAEEARARADEMEAAPARRRRLSELVSAVGPLLGGASPERWLDAPLPRTGETPRRMAEDHAGAWRTPWAPDPLRDLLAHLGRLSRMLSPGGEPVEDLLGLPLEGARERRRTEVRAREEEVRRVAEEARRHASAEAVRLGVEELRPLLGDDGAVAFVSARLGEACGARAGVADALDGEGVFALRRAVRAEVDRRRAEAAAAAARRRAEADAAAERMAREATERAEASRLREGLRAAALAAFGDPDRADLWMRAAHPRLGGERPSEHCRDTAAAARCRDLLVGARPRWPGR